MMHLTAMMSGLEGRNCFLFTLAIEKFPDFRHRFIQMKLETEVAILV